MSLVKSSAMIVCVALLACTLGICGCGKKESKGEGGSKAPALTEELKDNGSKKDSADLFDEFYNEKESGKGVTRTSNDTRAAGPVKSGVAAIAEADASAFDENGRYVVQISCVRSGTLADRLKAKLTDKGYPAYVSEVQNPTPALSGAFYRVRIGNFRTVSGARTFAERALTAAGYEYWIDNKSNDNVGISGSEFGSGGASGYEGAGSATPAHESSPATGSGGGFGSAVESTPAQTTPVATEPTPPPAPAPAPATDQPSSSVTSPTATESPATPASSPSTTAGAPSTATTDAQTPPATPATTSEPKKTDEWGNSWSNDGWGTSDTTKK